MVDIDPGYLSRILARFDSGGLVARERSAADGRRQVIRLTGPGREAITGLDTRSAEHTRGLSTGDDTSSNKKSIILIDEI